MVVQNNMAGLFAYRMSLNVNQAQNKHTERISSGYKINRADDDAAGLSISEKMRAQFRGLDLGTKNSQDAISFGQLADDVMGNVQNVLQRIRQLSVKAANDVNTLQDRQTVQDEVDQLVAELDRTFSTTTFNQHYVFQGRTVSEEGDVIAKGLANVMGSANVANVQKLNDPFTLGPGWISTGNGTAGGGQPGDPGEAGYDYGSAWLDFSDFGNTYTAAQLKNEGFNTTCATCDRFYNIKFITDGGQLTTPDNVSYNYVDSSESPRLEVNISGLSTGEEVANALMSAINSANAFNDHYTQYAINPAQPARIYVYDNRTGYATTGGSSTFEPFVRNSNGELEREEELKEVGTFWVQTGANVNEGVVVEKPVMGIESLNIANLPVLSNSQASSTIEAVDKALAMVTEKRAAIGAMTNRLISIVRGNMNGEENLQGAESRIRNADMAREAMGMVRTQILSQSGLLVQSQANSTVEDVLRLL